ncbi:hypothetical protein [Chamaesiphon sp. VAR_48_metabat_135_sub]|nr:hypothetical protein [Chamaesiphon sp. VAR_48_metabat_135_sub]
MPFSEIPETIEKIVHRQLKLPTSYIRMQLLVLSKYTWHGHNLRAS